MGSQAKPGPDESTFLYGSDDSTFEISEQTLAALKQRFVLKAELGRGGMGIVFQAVDLETKEIVAVKVLRPEIAQNPDFLERFREEVRLARRITHKSVCRTHELLHLGDTYLISMEFVEGTSLRQILNRVDGFSTRKTIAVLRQLCSGLKEAHAQGVVHRDLKPENVIIDSDGNARIMDFGIARSVNAERGKPTKIMGTPAHMAPEQAQGRPTDSRTDIYALGLILYEMLTGRPAFSGDTPLDLAFKQIHERPRPLRDFDSDVPVYLERITLKCLEKDPDKRFQSLQELERFLENSTPTRSQTVQAEAGKSTSTEARQWTAGDWLLVAVGLVCLAGFLLLFNRINLAALIPAKDDPVVVQKIAEDFARSYGAQPDRSPSLDAFGLRINYEFAVKSQGDTALRQELAKNNMPLWEWYLHWDETPNRRLQIWLSPDSKLMGLIQTIQPSQEQTAVSEQSARSISQKAIKDAFGVDVSTLKEEAIGEQQRGDGTTSVQFVWDDPVARLGLVRKYAARVVGQRIEAILWWDGTPAGYVYKKAPNWQIPTAIVVCVLVTLLGLLVAKHVELRQRWRVITSGAAFLLGGWGAYWDVASDDAYRPYLFFVIGMVSALVWFCGTITIEHSLYRLKSEKLESFRALFEPRRDARAWGRAVWRGTMLGSILLLLDSSALLFAISRLHAWLDAFIYIDIQPWYTSRWWPGIQLQLSALLQAIGIGLPLGFCCVLARRLIRHPLLSTLISALAMGLSGISWYMATIQPNGIKIALLSIEFFVLAWTFWSFDFLTCLTAIFTFSFIWGTTSIFVMTPNSSHGSEALAIGAWAVLLIAAAVVSTEGYLRDRFRRIAAAAE